MAAELWESERQRTARFVEQRRRDSQALHLAVLRRVNAHVVYSEHRQAQLQEEADAGSVEHDEDEAADADEQGHEDLALDFLEDMDADDMKSLLVEAATAPATTTAATVTASASVSAAAPSVSVLAPLAMPTHLLSVASAALVEDAGVSELMDELEIDVRSFAIARRASADAEEERKTEESTPPRHVLEQRVLKATAASSGSPQTPPVAQAKAAESAVAAAGYDPDAAAKEMLQWVSGERHPDVVKRRESLRGEKRKRVRRYGTNTLEEQVSVRRAAKMYAAEGDSSSSSGSSSAEDSDFSPVEIIEVDEDELLDKVTDEEPFSETELQLSDEDEDAKRKRKTKARRRLRQQAAKKKPRTKMVKRKATAAPVQVKKPVVVAAVTAPSQGVSRLAAREEESEEEEEIRRPRVFAKPVAVYKPAAAVVVHPAQEPEAIDLRSESENESEHDVAVDLASDGDSDSDSGRLAPQPAVEKAPTVLKLKVSPKDMLEITQKEMLALAATVEPSRVADKDHEAVAQATEEQPSTSAVSTAGTESEAPRVSADDAAPSAADEDMDDGYGTDEIIDEEPEDGDSAAVSAVSAEPEALPADAEPDADSDTGTVDFEQEELQVDIPEPAVDDGSSAELPDEGRSTSSVPVAGAVNERASPSTSAGTKTALTTENELQPVSPQVKRSPPYNTRALAEEEQEPPLELNLQAAQGDDDVSEAETVNFEEVDSDIDFGSGESEDFGEDGAVVSSSEKSKTAVDDDDEAEFGQFFGAPVKKKKKLATVPAKPQPVAHAKLPSQGRDASPVKPVRANDTPTPSPEATTKAKAKSSLLTAAAEPRGSNGLRTVANINTKTVSKGKYQYKRRAIRMVDYKGQVVPDPQSDGEGTRDPKRSLFMRGRQPNGGEETDSAARYLAYHAQASRPSTKDQFSSAAKAARERFDKTPVQASKELNGISFVTSASGVGTGAGLLKPLSDDAKKAKSGSYVPPRTPQLDVYQATGALSQIDDSYLDGYDKDGHKRPVAYQKEIAEAKRNGVDVRKGIPAELNPNAPIPKKSELQKRFERNPEHFTSYTAQPVAARDVREKEKETSPPKPKRAKTSSKPVVDDGRPSKYGPTQGIGSYIPSSGSNKHERRKDSASSSSYHSNDVRGGHGHSNGRESNGSGHSKKRQRTASPPRSRDRDRDHDRGRGRGRGDGDRYEDRDRSHRRSGSPKDSHHHKRDDRSRSPHGRSQNGGDSRRHRSSKSPPRSPGSSRRREEEKPVEADRRSGSYDERRRSDSLPSYVMSERLARSMSDEGSAGSSKKAALPSSTSERATPLLSKPLDDDARVDVSMDVAEAMDDGDSEIADSDDEIPMVDAPFDGDGVDEAAPPVFDIRVPLDEIEVDEERCRRTVYCFNLPPSSTEESLEALFSPYGIAEDRSTGFPAVEVFVCQRNNRARGDARVTFETSENACLAVSESDAATFRDAKLRVRAMDLKTMRILKAQFDLHRDTWTCPSASCRADVSVWTVTCPKCFCRRQFAPSHVNISPDSWLCSICYASNHQLSDKCSGCSSTLPPYQSSSSHRHSSRSSHSRDRSRSRDRDRGRGRDRRSY